MFQESENSIVDSGTDVSLAAFKNLGKEKFGISGEYEVNYLNQIKEASRFASFNLPPAYNEYFLIFEEAPLFWIFDTPLHQYMDEYLRFHVNYDNSHEHTKSIKEFYAKWMFIKFDDEKKFFATSALKIIEKFNNKNNFFFSIIQAVILSNEKSIFQPDKALEIFDKLVELVQGLKLNDVHKEDLLYLINLFAGFTALKTHDIAIANAKFSSALVYKPFGITAKFYLALTEVKNNNLLVAQSLVNDIVEYDYTRLKFSIEYNHINFYNYIVTNPLIKNIFYYEEFVGLTPYLEELLNDPKFKSNNGQADIKNKSTKLSTLKFSEFYDDVIVKNLSFISRYLQICTKESLYCELAYPVIKEKFNSCILSIVESVKKKHYVLIKEKMSVIEHQIEDTLQGVEVAVLDIDEHKKRFREQTAEAIKAMEVRVGNEVTALENRINNLSNEKGFDPKNSFSTGMVYNFVVAALVFLTGGSAGFSRTYVNDSEFNSVIMLVISTGLKWSLISFLIGTLIALIMAGIAMMERSTQKQKIIQRISALKSYKERQTEVIKKDFEVHEKNVLHSLLQKVEALKEKAKALKEDKDRQIEELKVEVDEMIKKETAELVELLK